MNRLVRCMDELKGSEKIQDSVIMQTGFSSYEPRYCAWQKFFSYTDMDRYMDEARIIITHGGPSSFIMALQKGKVPIVVPRKKEFGEHVNNHQTEFVKEVARRRGFIVPVYNTDNLYGVILRHGDDGHVDFEKYSNNKNFIKSIESIAENLVGGGK